MITSSLKIMVSVHTLVDDKNEPISLQEIRQLLLNISLQEEIIKTLFVTFDPVLALTIVYRRDWL